MVVNSLQRITQHAAKPSLFSCWMCSFVKDEESLDTAAEIEWKGACPSSPGPAGHRDCDGLQTHSGYDSHSPAWETGGPQSSQMAL